jgi:photosynthetic reaction center cytochrome c subunit
MKPGSSRTTLRAAAALLACPLGSVLAYAQAAPSQKPQMAEEVFKNVQVLKGIPVNEFLGIMGFFSASLGKSCVDCHDSDSGWENYVADTNPNKRTARAMIGMMNVINKSFFAGRQVVTCYSCHRGGPNPKVTPNLAALYSPPPENEPDDIVKQAPGAPSVDQILDKYIQAIGGAQKLTSLTSLAAKGTSVGYGLNQDKRPVEFYAKAPGQRTTIVHAENGDTITTYDGRAGWIAAPNIPVPVLPLTGGDLEGAKLDAELAFPTRIKQALGQWRVGPQSEIDDHEVQVVQGTSGGEAFATLYFDAESGLLVRQLRYASSPVGRMPTQIDYSDYREVSGVKIPFRWTVLWLDGRENFELTEVQANATIDAAKFAKPAPPVKPATP